jgi:hypothetical protein
MNSRAPLRRPLTSGTGPAHFIDRFDGQEVNACSQQFRQLTFDFNDLPIGMSDERRDQQVGRRIRR